MLRVLFTDLNLFFDELLVLRNKRLARNIKEPLIIRGGPREEKLNEKDYVAYILVQVMADWDGEKLMFEYAGPRSALYAFGQGTEIMAGLEKQYTEMKPELSKEGEVRPGVFIPG